MNIILVGCGKVGSRLAEVLADEGHDIVIVESDRNALKLLSPDFNGVTIVGVPIDQDVLKQAGIENADAFAAVSPDDNINIMACQVAKEIFKVPRVIARIYNPEREHVFHQFGLETVCPTNMTVDVIRAKVLGETGISHHIIGGESFTFVRHNVSKAESGKKLGTLKFKDNARVFGILQNGSFSFPDQNTKLNYGDIVILAQMTH